VKGENNMSVEKNKTNIRRHVEELWNKGDLAVADKIISPDYVYHNPLGEFKGPEGFKQMVAMELKSFPDIHFTIDDMVAEGDKVAVRYTFTGTFKGDFAGMAPTGKGFKMTAAFFYRFKDGKQVEALPFADNLTFYQQLGISPPPGQ
jgi:steroid delta-isomerase-like uncharacterized protein